MPGEGISPEAREEGDKIEHSMLSSATNVALEAMKDMKSDSEAMVAVMERYPRLGQDQVGKAVESARFLFTGEQEDEQI